MRINFDFTDLEAFLAVKETGSFHLASERLGLSQSAITRRIQKLETALDSTLFDRTTREVKPTLAAKRLQVRAESILTDTRETARALRDESIASEHQRAVSITLAVIPTLVAPLIAPALQAFMTDHPRSRFRLVDGDANEVADAVASGEADLGVCSVPVLEPNTTFELLFNDPLVIAMRADHALAGRDSLSWADVLSEALILPARSTGNRMMIDDALAATGLPVHWKFEVGRSATALDLVAQGLGVAPLPRSAVRLASDRRVVCLPVADPQITRPVGLLKKSDMPQSRDLEAFCNAIREQLAETSAQHGGDDQPI